MCVVRVIEEYIKRFIDKLDKRYVLDRRINFYFLMNRQIDKSNRKKNNRQINRQNQFSMSKTSVSLLHRYI